MLTRFEADRVVFRHASDDQAHDCGRACAQMVISSLTQGVPKGQVPTPSQMAQAVPVIQDDLRRQESDPNDVAGRWFTHPDELVSLLKGHAALQTLGHTDWRVASCGSRDELLEYVGLTLQRGRPAIINIRTSDHWAVVRSVDYESGLVAFVHMLDPLNKHTAPSSTAHTYLDGCAGDGTTWWSTIDLKSSELATWDLPVGTFPPANYAGRHVAIVYGPPPRTTEDWIALRIRVKKLLKVPTGPNPVERIKGELLRVSTALELPELNDLVKRDPPLMVRHVSDIDAEYRGYTIASQFSKDLGRGLIGVFDLTNQALMHFRLTGDRGLTDSIAGDLAEPLWWTRRPLDTFYSPYFPFRRAKAKAQATYIRLIDNLEFLAPPPKGEST